VGELFSLDDERRRRRGVAAPRSVPSLAVPDGVRAHMRVQGMASDGVCECCCGQLGAQWFVVGNLAGVFCSLACAEAMRGGR